ncbi:WD repeat-containing protein 24-like protein [Euroglyphus maynei]|uniref:GATOR2 complex protein WDR24 n=1 Tax=Euroglyphus maynei TaxID=6958 RepID=A0A1Y3BM75_EURMA|nr:WD repeat-containing protein 24-like protein [Euroglyphus maynei]
MFHDTMQFKTDSPVNAMAVSRDGLLAVAGRSLLKVYNLCNENGLLFGQELYNLRSSNLKNLNFSNSDVTWCPLDNDILATAATNGAVVVWNLQCLTKSKIGVVYNDHKRTVNKVCFHSSDPNLLLSGSQDGCMKLFDLRKKEAVTTFVSNSESVRDVQFSPHWTYHFAAVQENGKVEIWDIRKPDRLECYFIAHDGPVLACEWHPNQDKWLATGGRDKIIKVWDLNLRIPDHMIYNVHTITPVLKLKWRPEKDFHIGSCSLVLDFSVCIWDIKRQYVPFAIFGTKQDVTTGLAWKNDPFVFISSCKDGTIYQHRFETDAYYPAEHYPPIGIDFNPFGDVAFSTTDFIYRHSQTLQNSNSMNVGGSNRMNRTLMNNNIVQSNSAANLNHSLSTSLTQNNGELPLTNSSILADARPTTRHISIGSPSNQQHTQSKYLPFPIH